MYNLNINQMADVTEKTAEQLAAEKKEATKKLIKKILIVVVIAVAAYLVYKFVFKR